MKICSVEGCNNKHHAKGLCKYHYTIEHEKERAKGLKCSVEGCENDVYYTSISKGLCVKHLFRLKRNGNTDETERIRNFSSLIKDFTQSKDKLNYNFTNLTTLSLMAKLYYKNKCMICEWDKGDCEAHHIVPKSKGGKNTLNNIRILCPNCHSLQHKNNRKRFSDESMEELNIVFEELRNQAQSATGCYNLSVGSK